MLENLFTLILTQQYSNKTRLQETLYMPSVHGKDLQFFHCIIADAQIIFLDQCLNKLEGTKYF